MSKKIISLILIALMGVSVSCGNSGQKKKENVLIKTEFGDIKIKLYDDTPKHKANFLKLVDEGFYNDLLFHRVIKNFMIQGGDPDSKNAEPSKHLGGGNPGYTLPAEILPQHFHKKGVIAAARKGGASNPEKRSSGSQFYIIQGEVFTEGALDTMEIMLQNRAKRAFFNKQFEAAKAELNEFRENNDQVGFNIRFAEIRAITDSLWQQQTKPAFSPEKREAYTTIGGYPSLDGEYTVFGEVIEGLDVIDKIAAVETDKFDRPRVDVKMEMELVK